MKVSAWDEDAALAQETLKASDDGEN